MPDEAVVDTAAADTSAVDTAAVDTATNDVATVDTQTADTADAAQATDVDVVDTDAAIDPSPIAGQIKKAIDTLKATDPAAARTLRDLYHQQQAFKQEFPGGLKDVQTLKATLDSVGGAEGLQSLSTEKHEWDGIDQKFAAGDASVLDTFIANSPEGFAKLVPSVLNKFYQQDTESYNHMMSSVVSSTLDNMQFLPALRAMASSLARITDQNGNKLCEEELGLIQGLEAQYKGLKELSAKAPVKKIDPEREKLTNERKAFEQERVQAIRDEVSASTNEYAMGKYEGLIAAESKLGIALPEKGTRSYQNMLKEIDGEIGREMAKDKSVMQKFNALDATGKKADTIAYFNAQFDKIAPKVVQRVTKEWTTTKNPVAKTSAKTAATQTGGLKLAKAPERDQIDFSKTTQKDIMLGRAYLKGRNGLHTWMEQ